MSPAATDERERGRGECAELVGLRAWNIATKWFIELVTVMLLAAGRRILGAKLDGHGRLPYRPDAFAKVTAPL